LAEEIFGSSLRKSLSFRKHMDMNKLVVNNKLNVKRRKKKILTRRDKIDLKIEKKLRKEGFLQKNQSLF